MTNSMLTLRAAIVQSGSGAAAPAEPEPAPAASPPGLRHGISDVLASLDVWPSAPTGARRACQLLPAEPDEMEQALMAPAPEPAPEPSPTPNGALYPELDTDELGAGIADSDSWDEAWDRFISSPMPAAARAQEIFDS